jgi:hypothetical protein
MFCTPPFDSVYQKYTWDQIYSPEASDPSPDRQDNTSEDPKSLKQYDYYQLALPGGLPPSLQPYESSNAGVSSLMTDFADTWAFYYPVSHFLPFWDTTHSIPTTSLSSNTLEKSYDGFEQANNPVRFDDSGWAPTEIVSPQPITMVSLPFRAGIPFDKQYGASHMLEQEFGRPGSKGSTGSQHAKAPSKSSTNIPRRARRRQTDSSNAALRCPICVNRGFARLYKYNQHMKTHDPSRKRYPCHKPSCTKDFSRQTDLDRHDYSIHQESKGFKCLRCPGAFSRRDILKT